MHFVPLHNFEHIVIRIFYAVKIRHCIVYVELSVNAS